MVSASRPVPFFASAEAAEAGWRGRRVVVHGLGRSGDAAVRLLVRAGAHVVATDSRTAEALGPTVHALQSLGVELQLGGHDLDTFTSADAVVKSPGILPTHPALVASRDAGVPILGELELCAPYLGSTPVVGITGTNGKSTTTSLTAHLLQTAGKRVFVGGNLGTPLAWHVLEGTPVDVCVLELSSYQIDDLTHLRVDVAAILNLTPDHLERYGTMERYAASKERLLDLRRPGGVALLNADDARVGAMALRHDGPTLRFSRSPDSGAALQSEGSRLTLSLPDRPAIRLEVHAPTLRGGHNVENALAAAAAAALLGASEPDLQRGLDTYPGLPHRIERVAVRNGVEWVNDSKATNVDSVEKSLAALPGPIHWIAGGLGKGAPYAPLRGLVGQKVCRLYAIGQDGPRVAAELGDLVPVEACGDLVTAVSRCRQQARAGETVLLSPACASWDQFRSFEHRGDVFRALAQEDE